VAQRLRVFVSSPGDVRAAREIAALTIERLAQDYARFFSIEPYLWEYEAMVASGHFQDSIDPPSAFDVVVLILWSRLGTLLPERTAVREYRGIDGRAPLTGTEWEFEEALQGAKKSGAPDLLVYRSRQPALFDTDDPDRCEQQLQDLKALNGFWARHFANQGVFIGAYTSFTSDAEFAAALENHLRKLIERRIAALGVGRSGAISKAWAQAPFRGLECYEFEHAAIFFGQDEALTKAMLQLARNGAAGSPFLLVIGASGSGKSSLVKAGVLPKLFVSRRIAGTAFLRRAVFRPGDGRDGEDLFAALARRLTLRLSGQEGMPELIGHGQSAADLAAHLRNATATPAYPFGTALGQVAAQARQSGHMLEYETARFVLVVDQLEELYTNDRIAANERARFIELLAGLVHSGLVWVVATMRRDFWHFAAETPELVRMSEGDGRLELLPPTPSQLTQMIRCPAEAAAVDFERHSATSVPLNDAIAEAVAREPGALPLLSYLLDELYRNDVLQAHGSTLTYATYERLGRLEGAIAVKAEAVLERCAPEDRHALGAVLFALVEMGAAAGNVEHAVARRVPLAAFAPGTPQRRLVEALLEPGARLLVSDAEGDKSPTVRVAHEALISRWAQARDFVERNAEALKVRRRIEERYGLWQELAEGGRIPEASESRWPNAGRAGPGGWRSRFGREQGLLTDIDLADGRRLLSEHRADTEAHLVAFIERSIAHEQRLHGRTIRVLVVVASVVTLLAITASGAGWIASRKQHEAEAHAAQARQAQSRLLTGTAAERLKQGDTAGALAVILEVLANRPATQPPTAAAVSVFQDVRAADRQITVLGPHGSWVLAASYSPDATRIVTASSDKTARIWDGHTGVELAVLAGHGDAVASAAYSPDGARVLTGSFDKTARIWDARTGAILAVLPAHADRVFSAAYSPDGARIVTASADGTARTWDARTGARLAVLAGHEKAVVCAAYSPDGARIVTASIDRTARLWDARSGTQLAILSGHGDPVRWAAYSPDGTRVVTASYDRTVRIWDARTGALLTVLSGHTDRVYSAAYSADGAQIVTASADRTARTWDAHTGALLAAYRHNDGVQLASFSPDGTRIVTASYDRTARIWDARPSLDLAVLSGHADKVESASYSPDGSRIVTASLDKSARIWDAETGVLLVVLRGHNDGVEFAAYSPDGTRVVSASTDRTARIWDARSGAPLAVLSGHGAAVERAEYSPDGTRIVTASYDRTARIWDAHTGAQLAVLSGHGDGIESAAYSPDGARIATASHDETARIWDARTGVQLAVLSGHSGPVYSVAYSPDGARIVTASKDQTARVWDARDGVQLATLAGHGAEVGWASYSPDGTRIVTASHDNTVRIWDARSGAQLAVLSGHGADISTAVYSPGGARIVTAAADKTARIWGANVSADLETQVLWAQAAQIDPLTDVERGQLGLTTTSRVRAWARPASECDQTAAAIYDPDRLAPGVDQATVAANAAEAACARELARNKGTPRLVYQMGRALWAKHDAAGARWQFEQALAAGYRSAGVDLANLLADDTAGMLDPEHAVVLNEQAWKEGVSVAAFELGRLYESGARGSGRQASVAFQADLSKAWLWYQKGTDAGESHALARFADRDVRRAMTTASAAQRNALWMRAFGFYAAAADHAGAEGWPDEVWKAWRYRRATLARLLAREGMMQQVADVYRPYAAGRAVDERR
jgi:WD40 repeat protein/TPR repeat protein